MNRLLFLLMLALLHSTGCDPCAGASPMPATNDPEYCAKAQKRCNDLGGVFSTYGCGTNQQTSHCATGGDGCGW